MEKIALVAVSNPYRNNEMVASIKEKLENLNIEVVISEYLAADDKLNKAKELNDFFKNDSIDMIFDISGGDLANEILEYIDYTAINKPFCGYSDLTVLINAINTVSNQETILYQIRNIVYEDIQLTDFENTFIRNNKALYKFPYKFVRGNYLKGITVGGNVRCLLKLSGTRYWPDFKGKILVLEAYGGDEYRLRSYFACLKQLMVFNEISGLILGTFNGYKGNVEDLIIGYLPADIPIVKTDYIGHNTNSKAVVIGGILELK